MASGAMPSDMSVIERVAPFQKNTTPAPLGAGVRAALAALQAFIADEKNLLAIILIQFITLSLKTRGSGIIKFFLNRSLMVGIYGFNKISFYFIFRIIQRSTMLILAREKSKILNLNKLLYI